MLSGSVLSVWNKVERVLVSMPGGNSTKMQVIRLRTDDNQRIVGKASSDFCVRNATILLWILQGRYFVLS